MQRIISKILEIVKMNMKLKNTREIYLLVVEIKTLVIKMFKKEMHCSIF